MSWSATAGDFRRCCNVNKRAETRNCPAFQRLRTHSSDKNTTESEQGRVSASLSVRPFVKRFDANGIVRSRGGPAAVEKEGDAGLNTILDLLSRRKRLICVNSLSSRSRYEHSDEEPCSLIAIIDRDRTVRDLFPEPFRQFCRNGHNAGRIE